MYLEALRQCYLFHGCKARFLDEVLSVARMEIFMPNVSGASCGARCGAHATALWLPCCTRGRECPVARNAALRHAHEPVHAQCGGSWA